jgi:SM-20-related protein
LRNLFELAISNTLENGYSIIDNFIAPDLIKGLNKELETRMFDGQFHKAGIGNEAKNINEGQRSDFISWLEKDCIGSAQAYLVIVDNYRKYMNETCYLGLTDSETHFASYPSGAFYKKHLDAFKSSNKRKISMITYLNQDWDDTNGGELKIYHNGETISILPIGGRMVCFESAKIQHEVLSGNKERRSLTGWMLSL